MKRKRYGILLSLFAILLAGCHKQKPVTPIPAVQAPTITPQPLPPLPEIATAVPARSQPTKGDSGARTTQSNAKPPHHFHSKPKPSAGTPSGVIAENRAANSSPPKVSPEPVISTSPGQGDDHDRLTTQQLLDATDRSLLALRRQLSQDETNTVQQIRSYQKDAREALKAEDLTRAHNLALKAHLLSDALARAQ